LRREEKKNKWILIFFTYGKKEEEEEEEEKRRVCFKIRDSRLFIGVFYRRNVSSVILFIIDMMNSVHSLPTVLPTE
jgi:hypothetical protein